MSLAECYGYTIDDDRTVVSKGSIKYEVERLAVIADRYNCGVFYVDGILKASRKICSVCDKD